MHDFVACRAVEGPEFAFRLVAVVHVYQKKASITRVVDASQLVVHGPFVQFLARLEVVCHDAVVDCRGCHAGSVARDGDVGYAETGAVVSTAVVP